MITALLTSLSLFFSSFILTPLEIFATHIESIPFHLWDFFGLSILLTLIATALLFFIILVLPQKAYYPVCTTIAFLAMMGYAQGKIFTEGNIHPFLNLLLWLFAICFGIGLGLYVSKKQGTPIRLLPLSLLIAFLVLQTGLTTALHK